MITVDNITDEQIRELMIECRRIVAAAAPVRHDMNGSQAIVTLGVCEVALGLRRNRHGKNQKANARARCAEILNARGAK